MIESRLKENQSLSLSTHQLIEPISWATFASLQLLDVYTTYRGLKYDCVKETNPLFGRKPTVERMLLTKTALLAPAIRTDLKNDRLEYKTMRELNTFMFMIILNNAHVTKKAEKYCKKT